VGCLTDCGGKEPLLTPVVMGLNGITVYGLEELSPNPVVHCDSGLGEDRVSGLYVP